MTGPGSNHTDHPPGFHEHPHEHEGRALHRHPHHHPTQALPAHHHTHPTSFESLTYIVSPIHSLDPRAKIVASLVLVLGVVATDPLRPAEFVLFCALLAAAGAIARLPLGRVLVRSLAVLPVAATIALLAPLQAAGGSWSATGVAPGDAAHAWLVAWSIASKAWLSACCMLLLAATTRSPDLLAALRRLGVPAVFVMLLSFIARYVSVFAEQLRSLRIALISRVPRARQRVLLRALGGMAGNLFVRSYERGERVYAAMLSRGYTGMVPVTSASRLGAADALLVLTSLLTAAALALY